MAELDLQMPTPLTPREQLAEVARRHKARRTKRREEHEQTLDFEIRAMRLPAPIPQYRWATELVTAKGKPRQFRADFAWPAFRLLVEVQGGIWRPGGGAHSGGMAIERDIDKQQCAVLLGWWLFPVTTDDVKNGRAIGQVVRALAARGWQPPSMPAAARVDDEEKPF
jgi:very-short-patch-repair endonuclease